MLTASGIGLGRAELLTSPVDVHRRPTNPGGASVEVEVLPGKAEHLGDPPAWEEQERNSAPSRWSTTVVSRATTKLSGIWTEAEPK